MTVEIPIKFITPHKIEDTHLLDDGDNTGQVSSIISGTHEEIADGPYTVFRMKNTGQQLVYSNFTNGIYDTNLNSLSEVTPQDEKWDEIQSHVKKRTKSNTPIWLRLQFGLACTYSF